MIQVRRLEAIPALIALACAAPAAGMVGGAERAEETLARHVVMVVGTPRTACSGTAIGRDLVLTAAHCVPPGSRYGVIEPGSPRRTAPNRAAGVALHPQFNLDTALTGRDSADVALIKLAAPMSTRVMPAPLGTRDYFPLGDRFIVAGYGVSVMSAGGYGTLRSATLMVVRHTASGQLRLADPATRGEVAGLGACSGDSGGPVFEDSGERLALVGVVSWATDAHRGAGCGGVTGATPLVRFRGWISETADKLGGRIGP